MAFYYSSSFSPVPCRDITKMADGIIGTDRLADNKSDPNLETMTFGMWSSCERSYRTNVGKKPGNIVFFRTKWPDDSSYCVTGFYEIGWYLDSWYVHVAEKSRRVEIVTDRFLAASRMHFVQDPIPLDEYQGLWGVERSKALGRGMTHVDQGATQALRNRLLEQPDASPSYLEEIQRLEQAQRYLTKQDEAPAGYRYINWGRQKRFTWAEAEACVRLADRRRPGQEVARKMQDAGVSGTDWACAMCDTKMQTPRTIKICLGCDDGGWTAPKTAKRLDLRDLFAISATEEHSRPRLAVTT